MIERYDRAPDAPACRIHQEDFSQVLGAGGDQKYQKFGGKVSAARIAGVLSAVGDRAAVAQLLRMTTLAVAVGNLDMHAKNISLLHHPDGSISLAPAYDVVPQVHQPNDGEMALAVDREYRHRAITRTHLIAEGKVWGLSDAADVVDDTLATVLDLAATESPHPRAHPGVAADVTRFATNLVAGRGAGEDG
ncbi:type II toxin-antitoxin system HipA family toxin [Nocardia sp. FBN12]|uniref:type II toxin-antitoxin system HipA family toxin n=1 Tax=Nocardia sp. FBN12 TaxID=3419766 RepID=UPI003D07AD1B